MTTEEQKQHDYDYILKNMENSMTPEQLDVIDTMINFFDVKWRPKRSLCELKETIELRSLLKYKHKNLATYGVII